MFIFYIDKSFSHWKFDAKQSFCFSVRINKLSNCYFFLNFVRIVKYLLRIGEFGPIHTNLCKCHISSNLLTVNSP